MLPRECYMAMLLQLAYLAALYGALPMTLSKVTLLSLLRLLGIAKYVACDNEFGSPRSLQRVLLPPAYPELALPGDV